MPISFNTPPVGGDALTDTQRDIIRSALELGIALGVTDPTSTGVAGPIGAIGYNNEDPPKVYIKFNTGDTDWIQLGDSAGALLTDLSNLTAGALLQNARLQDYSETVVTTAASGATHTIDFEAGNVHDLTLDNNCTISFSNPPTSGEAGSITLVLRQDATGSRLVTWPAPLDWAGGTAPTLSTAASSVDILTFLTVDGGTTYYGFTGGQTFS